MYTQLIDFEKDKNSMEKNLSENNDGTIEQPFAKT